MNSAKKQRKTVEWERLKIPSRTLKDMKETSHAKIHAIKDRNSKELTEAEGIKKMWQEYTKELYKKGLNDPNNHSDVVTHLEPLT